MEGGGNNSPVRKEHSSTESYYETEDRLNAAEAYRLKLAAVLLIQRVGRGFLGRLKRKREWTAAVNDGKKYWEDYLHKLWWEEEKRRIAKRVRAQISEALVNRVVKQVVRDFVELWAAVTIQRVWRGYWVRAHPIIKVIPKKFIKQPLRRRYNHDTLRRVWTRRHYQPEGGWPGRADTMTYDIWQYTDRPPPGRDYGLRTHKIKGAPGSRREVGLLQSDKNAWLGLPIAVEEAPSLASLIPKPVRQLYEESPYAATALKGGMSRNSKARPGTNSTSIESILATADTWAASRASATRTHDAKLLQDLGMSSRTQTSESVSRLWSGEGGWSVSVAATGGDSKLTSGGLRSTQSSIVIDTEVGSPATCPSAASRASDQPVSLSAEGTTRPAATNSSSFLESSQPKETTDADEDVAQHEPVDIVRSRTAAAAGWAVKPTSEQEVDFGASSWGRLKSKAVEGRRSQNSVSGYRGLSRPRTELRTGSIGPPAVPRNHYRLQYTWLPQPMVQDAAQKVYDGFLPATVKDRDEFPLPEEPVKSLRDIEQQFKRRSDFYFTMEADLLSAAVSRDSRSGGRTSAASRSLASRSLANRSLHSSSSGGGVWFADSALAEGTGLGSASSGSGVHPYEFK